MYLCGFVLCCLGTAIFVDGEDLGTTQHLKPKLTFKGLIELPRRAHSSHSHAPLVGHTEILEVRGIFKKMVKCQVNNPDKKIEEFTLIISDNLGNKRKKLGGQEQGRTSPDIKQTKQGNNKGMLGKKKQKGPGLGSKKNPLLKRRGLKLFGKRHFKRPSKHLPLYTSQHKKPQLMSERGAYSEVQRKTPWVRWMDSFNALIGNKNNNHEERKLEEKKNKKSKREGRHDNTADYSNGASQLDLHYRPSNHPKSTSDGVKQQVHFHGTLIGTRHQEPLLRSSGGGSHQELLYGTREQEHPIGTSAGGRYQELLYGSSTGTRQQEHPKVTSDGGRYQELLYGTSTGARQQENPIMTSAGGRYQELINGTTRTRHQEYPKVTSDGDGGPQLLYRALNGSSQLNHSYWTLNGVGHKGQPHGDSYAMNQKYSYRSPNDTKHLVKTHENRKPNMAERVVYSEVQRKTPWLRLMAFFTELRGNVSKGDQRVVEKKTKSIHREERTGSFEHPCRTSGHQEHPHGTSNSGRHQDQPHGSSNYSKHQENPHSLSNDSRHQEHHFGSSNDNKHQDQPNRNSNHSRHQDQPYLTSNYSRDQNDPYRSSSYTTYQEQSYRTLNDSRHQKLPFWSSHNSGRQDQPYGSSNESRLQEHTYGSSNDSKHLDQPNGTSNHNRHQDQTYRTSNDSRDQNEAYGSPSYTTPQDQPSAASSDSGHLENSYWTTNDNGHQQQLYTTDVEVDQKEVTTVNNEFNKIYYTIETIFTRQQQDQKGSELLPNMVATTANSLGTTDPFTHATTTKLEGPAKVSEEQGESEDGGFLLSTAGNLPAMSELDPRTQEEAISYKVTPLVNSITDNSDNSEVARNRSQNLAWNTSSLGSTENMSSHVEPITKALQNDENDDEDIDNEMDMFLSQSSEASGDSEDQEELLNQNQTLPVTQTSSADIAVPSPAGLQDTDVPRSAVNDTNEEGPQSVYNPLEMSMRHGSESTNCRPGYRRYGGVCKSLCDIGDHYCENGGKCVIVENLGPMCRCHQTNNLCFRGECCRFFLTPLQLILIIGGCCIVVSLFLGSISLLIRRMDIKAVSKSVRTKLWISNLMDNAKLSSSLLSVQSDTTECADWDAPSDSQRFHCKKEEAYEGSTWKYERTRL